MIDPTYILVILIVLVALIGFILGYNFNRAFQPVNYRDDISNEELLKQQEACNNHVKEKQ